MRALAAGSALLAAASGCGEAGPVGEDRGVTIAEIERLSTPKQGPDPQELVRLEPIGAAEVEALGPGGRGCRLTRGGATLLAAVPGRALVRIENRSVELAQAGPLAETGGFFTGADLSVSVGRAQEARPDEAGPGWPARAAITHRRIGRSEEVAGIWACAGIEEETR